MAVKHDYRRKERPPLDRATLEQTALAYAGRYATTRSKLTAYLKRKLRELGWDGESDPPVADLVARLAELNYVDDRAFAAARGASLSRRGYGARRIGDALRAAGVAEDDAVEAKEAAQGIAWEAALRFAQKKRIGPFAAAPADWPTRNKALAAMMRAGHPADLARLIVAACPGEIPQADT
jgi:regulatory protein